MHRWLTTMLLHTDVRLVYAFAAVFVIPPCLILRKSARYSWSYFRKCCNYGVITSLWKVYLNHYLFAESVIDKFAMYAGRKFKTEVVGYEHYLELQDKPEAFVQLSAHIGNYEIAGYTLIAKNKRFNALVYGGEKESVMQNREKMFAETNIRILPIMPDMSHLFAMNEALANGEVLSMPADRVFGSKRTITATLLGGSIELPLGPFSVPTLRNSKVLAVNVMKTSRVGYTIYVTPLRYDINAARSEKIRQLADAWTSETDRMLHIYPEQWYNFYEFWK